MTTTYFKVLTPDLRDFHTGEFQYRLGGTHRPGTPPQPTYTVPSEHLLHASATPEAAARYGQWPYVLVECSGIPVGVNDDKYGFRQIDLPETLADVARCFGPNGAAVVDLFDELEGWSPEQWDTVAALYAARAAAGDAAARAAAGDAAARAAARAASWNAARDPARDAAAWAAVRAAVRALVVADLVGHHGLEQHHIDTLMAPIEAGRAAK